MLSVVIVNFETRKMLSDCLQDLRAQRTAFPVEILVVDNGSHDGSVALVREEHPEVRILANTDNLGFAAANNQGLEAARGHWLLLLNSDTRLPPTALQQLVDTMVADPRLGLLGCRLRNPDGSPQPSCVPARFPWAYSSPDRDGKALWVSGACLLVRREAYEQVGGLDEAFFYTGEDIDWAVRMRSAGWTVGYTTRAWITHLGAGTGRVVPDLTLQGRHLGRMHFAAKHRGPLGRLWARMQSTADLLQLAATTPDRARFCLSLVGRCWAYRRPASGTP